MRIAGPSVRDPAEDNRKVATDDTLKSASVFFSTDGLRLGAHGYPSYEEDVFKENDEEIANDLICEIREICGEKYSIIYQDISAKTSSIVFSFILPFLVLAISSNDFFKRLHIAISALFKGFLVPAAASAESNV